MTEDLEVSQEFIEESLGAIQNIVKHRQKFAMINCTCCNRRIPGKIISWPNQPNAYTEKDVIPLWKPCKECGLWLSHLEEDDPSLKGLCF